MILFQFLFLAMVAVMAPAALAATKFPTLRPNTRPSVNNPIVPTPASVSPSPPTTSNNNASPSTSPTHTSLPSREPTVTRRPTHSPTFTPPTHSPTVSAPTLSPSLREDGIFFTIWFDNPNVTLLQVTPVPTRLPTLRRPITSMPTKLPTTRRKNGGGRTASPIAKEYESSASPSMSPGEEVRPRRMIADAPVVFGAGVVDMPNTNIDGNANLSNLVNWARLYQGVHCMMDFLLLANNLAYSQFFISALPSNVTACNANFSDCFPLRLEMLITPVGQIYMENATCIVPSCGPVCDDACVLAMQFDALVTPQLQQDNLLLLGSTASAFPSSPNDNGTASFVQIRNLRFGITSNELFPSGRFCREDYLDSYTMALILNTLTPSPTSAADGPNIGGGGGDGPSTGLAVGIALSVFGAVLILCIIFAWFTLRRRQRMQSRKESDEEYAIDLSRLELGRQIGSGSSSKIFLAHYEGSLVCIKVMRTGVDTKLLKREVQTLRILKHPHIVQLYGYAVDENRRFMIMMELMDTSLDLMIRDMRAAHEASAAGASFCGANPKHFAWCMDVARQIALALHFCHSKDVVHCDVKPANVLFKGRTVKLCDLGIAKLVNAKVKPENIQGTISYMSPERLRGSGISKAIDVYAFAIVLWQIFHLESTPYASKLTRREIHQEIINHRQPRMHAELDPRVARLICQAWDGNPDLRPTFNEILSQLDCISPDTSSGTAGALGVITPSSSQPMLEDEDDNSVKWTSLDDVLLGVVEESKRRRRSLVNPLHLSPRNATHIDQSFEYDGESFVFNNGLVVRPEHGDGPYDSSKIRRIALLGQGNAGQVHSGVHVETWELVAIKEVSRFFDEHVRAQARKEIEALALLKHERIVAMRALYFNANFASLSITLVLEYVMGESLQHIVDYSHLPMDEHSLRVIAQDVTSALQFCREQHVAHLDLKPANILVAFNGRAKLADFGLAKLLPAALGQEEEEMASTFLGTALYMSPERARGEAYGFPADVWSLGLSLATAALGEYPLSETRQFLLLGGLTDVREEFTLPRKLSRAGASFILRCLALDPEQRPMPAQLVEDEWFAVQAETNSPLPPPPPVASAFPLLVLADFADKLVEEFDSFDQLCSARDAHLENLAQQFALTKNQVLVAFSQAFARKREALITV